MLRTIEQYCASVKALLSSAAKCLRRAAGLRTVWTVNCRLVRIGLFDIRAEFPTLCVVLYIALTSARLAANFCRRWPLL
ncbi:Hypothetical predicted protein [Cloeon dipterum]|uniref:Uncharacterized protein n=1 Tax=Cloeon dipterum TaxID=197152 RepID=A0A8S1CWD4_9INSE|nr:Hypothetical predicted protein [Cloeon dipterum]